MATIELRSKQNQSRKSQHAQSWAVNAAKGGRDGSGDSPSRDDGAQLLLVARCLYYATLDLLAVSDDPARDSHRLADPLRRLVWEDHTLAGQVDCARIAAALVSDDPASALDACRHAVRRASMACAANKLGVSP